MSQATHGPLERAHRWGFLVLPCCDVEIVVELRGRRREGSLRLLSEVCLQTSDNKCVRTDPINR
jgi:hypothetical protein